MFTNAIELTAAGISNSSRAFIAECSDLALLTEALALEEARDGGPRRTRIGQLTLRIEQLRAAAPASEVTAPVVEIAEAASAAVVTVEEPAVLDAEPVTVEAPVVAPVATVEASTAVALIKAIDAGSVDLVRAVLAWIRQSGDLDLLAAALVETRKGQAAPARRVRTAPSAVSAPRSTTTDKLAAVIAVAEKADDGTVTIKGAHLVAANAPSSWGEFSGSWYSTLVEPVKALGYTAKVKRVDGAQQIVLTPVAPAAE